MKLCSMTRYFITTNAITSLLSKDKIWCTITYLQHIDYKGQEKN